MTDLEAQEVVFAKFPEGKDQRWNVEVQDGRIVVCRRYHDKREACEWEDWEELSQ